MTLPRIIQFLNTTDAGEYGLAVCPHCDAKGRYVHHFIVEGGERRGAMAGCIKRFPVSKIAKEHKAIMERAQERADKGQSLASWDDAKLSAIEAFYRGEMTEQAVELVILNQNNRRQEWTAKRFGARR